ncbi:MAG TPA: tripartite tricarboxylate transporter substrate binding protein [Burkholderiales bacterium]|nr:tripartite tricarboxylate transporter substrate binding protein [Burkholderiales bacterium]
MKIICDIAAVLSILLAAGTAFAQENYPEQPVRILVGFTPGVAPDVAARLLADKLAEALAKPVVVENVTGAGGNIGALRVAKAAPDGYTLGMVGNGSLIFSPSMYDKLGFDPIKDFAPISQMFVAANVLVVPISSPAKTLPELVALARALPGKLTYAHAGAGTSQHLAAELFKSMAKLEIEPIAYRGTTVLLPDLLAGRVSMSFGNVVNVLPLVRDGKLRAFAVTSIKRSGIAPDIPTMAESGYPGFEAVPWFGLMAPAGTPQAIVDRLHRESAKIMATPEIRKKLNDIGADAIGGTPAELAAVIEREIPQWAKVIKQAGIKAGD